jgi:putative endonuclease
LTARRQALGRAGEAHVARWYRQRGYDLVAQNWRWGRGELDLVVCNGRVLVFCEVKTRSSDRFGTGLDAVTPDKQRRVRHLAAQFLAADGRWRGPIRFDVASVVAGRLDVVENAF